MNRTRALALGLTALVFSGLPAAAQLPTEKILPLNLALEAATTAMADCKAKGYDTTSAVVIDRYGIELVVLRSEKAKVTRALRIARRKAYTALETRKPSRATEDAWAKNPQVFQRQAFINPGYTPQPGGLPIKAGNTVIGAIAVAGTPGGVADEQCAMDGIAKIQDQLK